MNETPEFTKTDQDKGNDQPASTKIAEDNDNASSKASCEFR